MGFHIPRVGPPVGTVVAPAPAHTRLLCRRSSTGTPHGTCSNRPVHTTGTEAAVGLVLEAPALVEEAAAAGLVSEAPALVEEEAAAAGLAWEAPAFLYQFP